MGLQGVTSCLYLMCGPRRICFLSSSWRFSARLAWVSRSRLRLFGFVPDRQVACLLTALVLVGMHPTARRDLACRRQVGGWMRSAVDEDAHYSFAVVRGTRTACQRSRALSDATSSCGAVPLFFAAIFFQGTNRGGADTGQCSQRFRVIVRHLLQHETNVSRRALLRGLASAGSVIALGGCAGLGATGASYDASSFAGNPTLLVTTTRKRVNGGRAKPWFGPERASTMTVATGEARAAGR